MIHKRVLHKSNWKDFSKKMQKLESLALYPYGSSFFRINHGSNYFAFFERLGEPLFHVALDGDEVIASACGILRGTEKGGSHQFWYLCDLKVHPDYRGQKLSKKLFRKNLLRNYLLCGRGFAVSMNPPAGTNHVVRIIQKFSWLPFDVPAMLNFFELTHLQVLELRQQITRCVGPFSFLSLEGKKDLILESTQQPMKVLHLQHGPFAEGSHPAPQSGAIHLACAVDGSEFDRCLKEKISPSAHASVISHRMAFFDWTKLLTSDI